MLYEHHEADYFHSNEDGSVSILVDAQDKEDILLSLARHHIDVVCQEDALFGLDNKVYCVEVTRRAQKVDILFALDSATKPIRPFPKGYSRVP